MTRAVLTDAGIDYAQTYAELGGIFELRDDGIRAKAVLDATQPAMPGLPVNYCGSSTGSVLQ